MTVDLKTMVGDFAKAIQAVDATAPINPPYQPGIGPFDENDVVGMIMARLGREETAPYGSYALGVPYGGASRQRCDLCLGSPPEWDWAIEVKAFRMLGDNGRPNDYMLKHLLSPYPLSRSALSDCEKLVSSNLAPRRAILIYGYDPPAYPLDVAIDAFEFIASRKVRMSPRASAPFDGLIHPVHQRGAVFAWELLGEAGP
jgi:hypothetical protein